MIDPDDPTPPCPTCGTAVNIEWIDVTALGEEQSSYIPGPMNCPANKRHDVQAAAIELSWPAGLTDDDRAWLRKQIRLAKENT